MNRAPSAIHHQSEAEFQRAVVQLARAMGWSVFHIADSRKQVTRRDGARFMVGDPEAAGIPDLLLARERCVWAELKRQGGRLREQQRRWIDRLTTAGQEVYVWRPSDWAEIERILTARAAA